MAKSKATKSKATRARKASVKPPARASVRPKPATVPPAATESVASRWEERADKDAYALDLLDRLVRYFTGRASATGSDAMRSTAVVLSTVSLNLAAGDGVQLDSLARAARQLRKGGASQD